MDSRADSMVVRSRLSTPRFTALSAGISNVIYWPSLGDEASGTFEIAYTATDSRTGAKTQHTGQFSLYQDTNDYGDVMATQKGLNDYAMVVLSYFFTILSTPALPAELGVEVVVTVPRGVLSFTEILISKLPCALSVS